MHHRSTSEVHIYFYSYNAEEAFKLSSTNRTANKKRTASWCRENFRVFAIPLLFIPFRTHDLDDRHTIMQQRYPLNIAAASELTQNSLHANLLLPKSKTSSLLLYLQPKSVRTFNVIKQLAPLNVKTHTKSYLPSLRENPSVRRERDERRIWE